MRKQIYFTLFASLLFSTHYFSQVGIGNSSPNASAILDLSNTTKGFLMPRMSSAQRDAIANPAIGLQIYNTTTNCINYFNQNGWYEITGTIDYSSWYTAVSIFCNNTPTVVINVINPTTGKSWMDRNLGASQVATSATDAAAYGDLYQWGRGNDGHQCRTSATTTTLSSSDQPGHGNFICNSNINADWRSSQNNNLWQGVNGINNPCPNGYRLPTNAELSSEISSWSSLNSTGSLNSAIKLPIGGNRAANNGSLSSVGSLGYYFTSTLNGSLAYRLSLSSASASIVASGARAVGMSVRCIKD
jgi:uncharacterized protein (TIGR02145 family)